jgi:hypothetical protein
MNGGGKKTGEKIFPAGHLFRIESIKHNDRATRIISSLVDPEEKVMVSISLDSQFDDSGYWPNEDIEFLT